MEKDLFPSHGEALRLADLSPAMERVPEGGCGCDGGGHEGCGPDSWGLCEYPLAMVYAPCQTFRGLYDPETALSRGTLFTELDLPLGKEDCGLTAMSCARREERRRV